MSLLQSHGSGARISTAYTIVSDALGIQSVGIAISPGYKLFAGTYLAPPPQPPTQIAATPQASAWTKDNTVDILWTSADDPGGNTVVGYSYLWSNTPDDQPDNVVDTTQAALVDQALSDGSSHWFHVVTIGNYGNKSERASIGPFLIDTKAPETTPSPDQGTYASVQSVSLSCSDGAGSGCAAIHYTTNGDDPTENDLVYTSPIPIPATSDLKYFAIDAVGNAEPVQAKHYTIDIDGPLVPTGDIWPTDGSNAKPVYSISGTAQDVHSGVAYVEIQITDGTYYLSENQVFVSTPTWINTTGTMSWSIETNSVIWDLGTTYTITVRATDSLANQTETTTTFTFDDPMVASFITCLPSSSSITVGGELIVSGQITELSSGDPPGDFNAVEIVLESPSGATIVRSDIAEPNGQFAYTLACNTVREAGVWTVFTRWSGDGESLLSAKSATESLEVIKADTDTLLEDLPTILYTDAPITISGQVRPVPDCGADMSGLPVKIYFDGPLGLIEETTVTHDVAGHFQLLDYTGLTAAGSWTLVAQTQESPGYKADTSDPVATEVFNAAANAKAIVVAGGGPFAGNNLWDSTKLCCDFAFTTLYRRGFSLEQIRYLSHETATTNTKVTHAASNLELSDAITSWALDADELIVYLHDHGGDGTFRMGEKEWLSAETHLDAWLDSFQSQTGARVVLIYEACQSGSFLQHLVPETNQDRILITSASVGESAYSVSGGTLSFSWLFWSHTDAGSPLRDAFVNARRSMQFTFDNKQNPLLEATGDVNPNQKEDLLAVLDYYIGVDTVPAGDQPVIGSVSAGQCIYDTTASASFRANDVTGTNEITRVWATILRPDHTAGDPNDPVTTLPSSEMVDFNTYWLGSYNQFDMQGNYIVTIYAQDSEGVLSQPMQTIVVKDPVTGDVDGDSDCDMADMIVTLQALSETGTNVRPLYSAACADADQNGQLGLSEAIYILQELGGMRAQQ